MQKADCHCHTYYSDGSLCVRELLALAQERELTGLSITDHDTLAAYPEAQALAKAQNLSLVSGIEISTMHLRTSIHVLGYAFDLKHPELLQFCELQQQQREARNRKILERLNAAKRPIEWEELTARFPQRALGRPHIAAMMMEKGYVTTYKEAFDRFLGEKGRCFIPGFDTSPEQAIEIIHRAGGFAVLAHPHFIERKKVVESLSTLPFDGLEVFYSVLTVAQEKPWYDLAVKKNWLMTGGSDFHGEKKPYAKLGCSFTPAETFTIFEQRFAQHSH